MSKALNVVYSDLNTRLSSVDSDDNTVITDSNAIKQSLIRLFKTEEGEIPNYRVYGLSLKKFLHYPLSDETAQDIYDEIEGKVRIFETRATIIDTLSTMTLAYDESSIKADIVAQVNNTGELITLPTLNIVVNA